MRVPVPMTPPVTRLGLADPVILASGWQRFLIAGLAGAASTLALAPIGVWPVMFVTLPVLVWLLDGIKTTGWRAVRTAFTVGWWFGFGYFLAGVWWVGAAFLVDARTFGWLLPFAITALPAWLAVLTGAGTAVARLAWSAGPWRIVTFAAALAASEWLRGQLLSGFPWNAFGYALTGSLPLAQGAAIAGIWGLTLFAVLVFAAPALFADTLRRGLAATAAAALALMALAAWGAVRLEGHPGTTVGGVHLRIMQPNIPQDDNFSYGARTPITEKYIALSQSRSLDGVTHLIWPESAFPFYLVREPDALAAITAMLPDHTTLITGAARPAGAGSHHAYNSVYALGHQGPVAAVYDKVHLVPFGEYLPFESLFARIGLTQLTGVPGGFLAGGERRSTAVGGAPAMLPLVCYEAIFPEAASADGDRPGWLLNLTNDAWFGITPGPYQHFAQARVRAIEQGLPLVRAANSGISGVVDPMGRVLAALPLGEEGLLDSTLPEAAPATLYARSGDLPFILTVIGLLGAALLPHVLRKLRP